MSDRLTTFALLLALSFTPAVTANQQITWSPGCRTPILRGIEKIRATKYVPMKGVK